MATSEPFDPFKELQLSPDAEPELIKAAFKALAKKYHPDRYTDPTEKKAAEEKMARINEAQKMIQDGYRPSQAPPTTPVPPPEQVFRSQDRVDLSTTKRPPQRKPQQKKESETKFSFASFAIASIVLVVALTILPNLFGADHLKLALEFEDKGQFQQSLDELNKAVAKSPHDRDLYRHRARIWEKLGHPDRAQVDLKNAEPPKLDLHQDQVPEDAGEKSPSHVPRTERHHQRDLDPRDPE